MSQKEYRVMNGLIYSQPVTTEDNTFICIDRVLLVTDIGMVNPLS